MHAFGHQAGILRHVPPLANVRGTSLARFLNSKCRDAASVLGVLEADSNSCVCQGEIQVAELHSRNVYVWYKLTIKVVQGP